MCFGMQTGWFFGARVVNARTRNAMSWTGFLASLLTFIYCLYELVYYYVHIVPGFDNCASFKVWLIRTAARNDLGVSRELSIWLLRLKQSISG